jgi:phage terminase large subunit-like protein
VSWKQRQEDALRRYQEKNPTPWSWEFPEQPGWTPWSARSRRNVRWLEANCYVPDGPKAGQRLRLTDHQMEKVRRLYLHEDRLPRVVVFSEARKNAKTATASFIVLLHTLGPEAKPFQQVVTAARVREQAAITFDYCVNSIQCSPTLSPVVDVRKQKKEFEVHRIGTIYRALSKDAKANLGKSPAVVIHDELGQVEGPVDELYNNVETAMKAHMSPMTIIVSTQAPKDGDLLSLIIDDIIKNPRPTAVLFLSTAPSEPEEGVEEPGRPPEQWAVKPDPTYPYSEAAILAANPEAGILCNIEELRRDADNARRMPSLDASYRNLTLNQRVDRVSTFISRPIWNSCGQPGLLPPPKETRVWLGLDLSEVGDLTALGMVWEDGANLCIWAEGFLPEVGIRERSRRDRVPYDVWAKQGLLTLVPGNAIDEDWVAKERVLPLWGAHTIVKAGYDRWGFRGFRKALRRANMTEHTLETKWEPVGMGTATMTPVLKELEGRLLNRTLRHGLQPVLTMAASNVVVAGDAEARRPSKRTSRARIDPIVAVMIALAAWLATPHRRPPEIHLL